MRNCLGWSEFLSFYFFVNQSIGEINARAVFKYRKIKATINNKMAQMVKNPPANAGDTRDVSPIPGLGRSPGGGHGNPLQYSCLENSMDRGTWWVTVHGVKNSGTWLNVFVHAHTHTYTHAHTNDRKGIGCKNPDMEDWFLENCRRMALLNWPWKKLQWLLCYNSHKGLYMALVSFHSAVSENTI